MIFMPRRSSLGCLSPSPKMSSMGNVEGNHLALTKDKNYVTIPTGAEFVECTIAQGHFCTIKNVLCYVINFNWCLAALFLKRH